MKDGMEKPHYLKSGGYYAPSKAARKAARNSWWRDHEWVSFMLWALFALAVLVLMSASPFWDR